jgi:hypothetical protein
MEIIKTPQTDVQAFLYSELNIEIFEDLTENADYDGLFDPLYFLNFLYSEFEFYNHNDENYLNIKTHFNNLTFESEKQKYYFFWALRELIIDELHHFESPNTIQKKSSEIIENIFDQLYNKFKPTEEAEPIINPYDFELVKTHLETLQNDKEKINYLILQKTNYLQSRKGWILDDPWETSFDKKCELEITKLKELLKTPPPQQSKSNAQPIKNTLNWQGTQLEFTELIKALLLSNKISPELSQKEVFNRLKEFFNVDAFNENDKIRDIRNRTNTPTPFINTLETSLDNWIKSKD